MWDAMVVCVVFVDADRQCIATGMSCAVTDDKRADVLLCQPVQHFLPISTHTRHTWQCRYIHTHIIPDNAGTPQTLTSHLTSRFDSAISFSITHTCIDFKELNYTLLTKWRIFKQYSKTVTYVKKYDDWYISSLWVGYYEYYQSNCLWQSNMTSRKAILKLNY